MSDFSNPKPQGEWGTIDWDAFFEDGEIGLISLIEKAKSMVGIRKCVDMIIDMLYMRDEDAPHKEALKVRLNALIPAPPANSSAETEETKKSVVRLLREIKEDRVRRALARVEQQEAGAVAKEDRRVVSEEPPESSPAAPKDAQTVFVDVF